MICELPQFTRCCFCMPLRRGVLTFGYLNIIFSIFMLGIYSYCVHNNFGAVLVYRGVSSSAEAEFCIAIYCVDILFNVLMVYGAHKHIESYLKIFYFYTLSMTVAVVIIEMVTIIDMGIYYQLEMSTVFIVGLCIHLYLLFLVRSLLQKMEDSGRAYENHLHQFFNGEIKLGESGVFPNTVIPVEHV